MTNKNGIRRLAAAALLFGLVGSMTACDLDKLLEVTDRDRVNEATLEDPDVIDVVVTGALGDFVGAYSGGESYLTVSALMSDEWYSAGTFTTRTATDRRDQFTAENGNTSDGTYTSFQSARRALKDAAIKLAAHPDRGTGHEDYQMVKALEGYAILGLAEGWCSAVPLSNVDEAGEFVYGSALTSAALADSAIAKFNASLAGGTNSLAAIGKARALTFKGDYAAAASAVAGVATDYVWFIPHSVSGSNNTIFSYQQNGRYSISNLEGGNGLAFLDEGVEYTDYGGTVVAAGDPRIAWYGPIPGFDEGIDQYMAIWYDDFGDDVPLATGIEARLIEAEAALANSQFGQVTTILNGLRADVTTHLGNLYSFVADGTLADLPAATTQAEAMDQLFHERGFWLYLTGHRLADLRRMVANYGMAQSDVYPSGAYFKGGDYGTDVVFQMDFDESNNTEYSLDQCNVSSAGLN